MIALKRYFLAAVFAGACCSVCRAQTQGKSETIVADFERAVRTVQEQPKWPSGTMYSDMEGAANDFVRKHSGSSALDVLQDKIKGNRKPRKLALLVLAKLAVADEAAEEVFLHGAIYGKNRLVAQEAVIAVAYLDPADGRGIAEKLMTEPGPWEVRKAAVEMLVGLGDEHTLETFKTIAPEEKYLIVKKAIESAIIELEHRLTRVGADKQAEWAQQELVCWRTLRETPLPRDLHGENGLAADTFQMQKRRFSPEYLEYKLNKGDMLAVAIIGNQRDEWAVEGLKQYARRKDALGDFARASLAKIGTEQALRALEESLVPGGHGRANTHLTALLQFHGDRASAEFLRQLASDERFGNLERASFAHASTIIEKRLGKNIR